ncbi:unnamed protein product [Sphagnum balticum]
MMGSGKTTVGRVLSKSLGYYFFDRSRTWLFLSYVIAFVSLAGSAGMLVQDALLPDTPSSWTGIAGVLQCTFVLTRYTAIISLFSCISAAEEIIDSSKVCTTGGQMAAVEKVL